MLKGLFDRPILKNYGTTGPPVVGESPHANAFGVSGFTSANGPCAGTTSYQTIGGSCVPKNPIKSNPGGGTGGPGGTGGTGGTGPINVTVNDINTVTQQTIQNIQDAITSALNGDTDSLGQLINASQKTVVGEIQEDSDAIKSGIDAASTNLGNEVTITTSAIGAAAAATGAAVATGANTLLSSVKDAISSAIGSVTSVIDSINSEVQAINDTLIQPIITFYNTTVGTIAALTTAIEQDLKDGITGLLQLPGQLAAQLASEDALLNRTVEQLGSNNLQNITSGIDYEGQVLPDKYSASFQAGLAGKPDAATLLTTFSQTVGLSSESLSSVSAEAIAGLGTLLDKLLGSISSTFSSGLTKSSSTWQEAKSLFVGLLDGVLTLITTVTAMGALASPLIDAAQQQARTAVPTAKLDPATVIEAMKRQFISTENGLTELATYGFDSTRTQVLQDLGVFLADVNQALDWWYRGIISDDDFAANMNDHGIEPADQTAIKEGSIRLPDMQSLLRWLNFGIITQDQFTGYLQMLRLDAPQISAILSSYQERETPQTLSQLDGLLNVSGAGWLSSVFSSQIPDSVSTAGQRAGIHPDLVRYIWLSHYNIPDVQMFVNAYFRGIRTLTELQQRMQAANIPQELWGDIIATNQALIPYRSIPTYVKAGLMTLEQAQTELAAHGFDLAHQQIILASLKPPASTTNQAATAAVKTLSQANAKELWSIGAITDAQYETILEAHGYTAQNAQLQVQADQVTEHIKQQKQTLADLTAEVEAGVTTIDAATTLLNQQGFTPAQISAFTLKVNKAMKVNTKIPSIAEMLKFIKDGLITVDQFTSAITSLGWQDPWLTAYITLARQNVVPPPTTGTATS